MTLKFRFLTGDCNWQEYGGKFISKRLNNGDWNYYLVINVVNLKECCGDDASSTYQVELQAVSPEAAGTDKVYQAWRSMGYSDSGYRRFQDDPLAQVECLSEYGIFATLWYQDGNNLSKLMAEAHKQAKQSEILFGFMMDRPENRIGDDGWNRISGVSVMDSWRTEVSNV